MIRVQMDEEDYRLVGPGGEEGELVAYGQPASLKVGDAIYYAVAEGQEEQPQVCRVDSVTIMEATVEEVAFEFPDEEEEDGEEEEGDEDGTEEEEEPEEEETEDDSTAVVVDEGEEGEEEEEEEDAELEGGRK